MAPRVYLITIIEQYLEKEGKFSTLWLRLDLSIVPKQFPKPKLGLLPRPGKLNRGWENNLKQDAHAKQS